MAPQSEFSHMLAKSPKTYRKLHVTRWRTGWRYKRRVPTKFAAVLGRTEWSKYLGAISEPDAIVQARKLDVEHDATIERLLRLTEADRKVIATHGGLKDLAAKTASAEGALPFIEAVAIHFREENVDLDAPADEFDGPLEQLKAIRDSKKAGEVIRREIAPWKSLLHKAKGDDLGPRLANLVPLWQRVAAPRCQKSVAKKHLYLNRFIAIVGDMDPKVVNRQHVVKFRDAVVRNGESRTNVKHMLEELHRLFSVAMSENLIEANPFAGVKLGSPPTPGPPPTFWRRQRC